MVRQFGKGGDMRAIWIGYAVLAAGVLGGCSDRTGDYPKLLPTDQVLAEPRIPSHAAVVAQDPQETQQALSTRAAGLSASGAAGPGADSTLAARAEALQSRAAALRKTSLDCPETGKDCPSPAATPDAAAPKSPN